MNIIDSIESLKNYTNSSLSNQQKFKIPYNYKLNLEERFNFRTHGFNHSQYKDTALLYTCSNLPFMINRKRHVYADTLDKVISKKEIKPFMLFINGKFIKWTDIIIICDCKYNYILINNVETRRVNPEEIGCIILPDTVQYQEQITSQPNNAHFIFNSRGRLTTEVLDICTAIYIPNTDIYYERMSIESNRRQYSSASKEIKLLRENILVFKNGLYHRDAEVTLCGINTFDIDGNSYGGDILEARIFYDLTLYNPKDNLLRIEEKGYLFDKFKNKQDSAYSQLIEPFDFKYDKNLSYQQNLINSLNYIMSYNSSLMNSVYEDKSPITIKKYSGNYINSLKDNFGYVTMSRNLGNDNLDNYVIVFKNGMIYEQYSQIAYKNKNFTFPVINIIDTDIIEVMYLKNVNNNIYKIKLLSSDKGILKLGSSININDCKIYCMDAYHKDFDTETREDVKYEISFIAGRLDNNTVKIHPDNSYYYDRTLDLVPKSIFRYSFKIIQEDECYNIVLPHNDFMYCNDESKFLVYVNGKMIPRENYRITIIKTTRPFDEVAIYTNIPLRKSDKVEVFYMPFILEEIPVNPNVPITGNLVVGRSDINYPLSKDLLLFFINGRKLRKDQLIDIDANKIKIIDTDISSSKNLTILKYIPNDNTLYELFMNNISTMEQSINTNINELTDLFGISNINDIEDIVNKNAIGMKEVIYKVIYDYYLAHATSENGLFVYDFDDTEFTETDNNGNIIIRALDANMNDKIID